MRRSESGQTTLLLVGFLLVAALTVGVAVNASAAYLRRQGLDSLADGAALAAADAVRGRQVYEGGLGERALVDPAIAQTLVTDYLAAVGAVQHYPGLRYSVDASAERIVVRVSAPLDLPITPPGWAERPVISATAASYVVVAD